MKRKNYTLNKLFSKARYSLMALCLGVGVNATAATYLEIEAEEFDESNVAKITENPNFSGGAYLAELRGVWGSWAKYDITVDAAGTYDLTFMYTTEAIRYLNVKANNQVFTLVKFDKLIDYDGEEGTEELTTQIYLEAGANTLEFWGYMGWSPNIDKFIIENSKTEIAKPADQIAPIVWEAEEADELHGTWNDEITEFEHFSGGFGFSGDPAQGFIAQYNSVTVPEAGAYDLYVYYTSAQDRSFSVKIGEKKKIKTKIPATTPNWEGNDDDLGRPGIYRMPVTVYMEKGANVVKIEGVSGWTPNFDKFVILKSGIELSDPGLETYSSVFDYTDIAKLTEATATSKENLAKLNDNTEHTVYTVSGSEAKITAELPYPIILTGFAYASKIDAPYDNGWELEISEDGSEWYSVSHESEENDNGFWTFLTGWGQYDETIVSAKYFRLTATGTGNVEIGEWQLYGLPLEFPADLIDRTDESYIDRLNVSAGHEGFYMESEGEVLYDERFPNAINGKIDSEYTVLGTNWFELTYEFADEVTLKSYSLTVPYKPDYTGRDPKNWTLYGFTAAGGEWVEIDTRSEMSFPVPGSTLMFDVKNPVKCYAYKLNVTDNAGAGQVHLTEWQMFGEYQITPLSIESSTAAETASAFGADNKIIINSNAGESYNVYDLMGKRIKSGLTEDSITEIAADKGVYIVRISNTPLKVFVK